MLLNLLQIGTLAGNLMTKHKIPSFQSDIFILFECVGALVTLGKIIIPIKVN